MHGLPAILTPVMTSGGGDMIRVTKAEASWFTTIGPMFGMIGFLFVPYLMQTFGRRFTFGYLNIITLIGTIIIASATNYTWLLVGRAIEGTAFCQTLITFVIGAEYSHPKRRGLVITMAHVSIVCGVTLCHGLSAKLTWRQICWLFTAPAIIGAVLSFFWPESPSWLAYKGRYQECEEAFLWLRGDEPESRKELEELIIAQKQIRHMKQSDNTFKSILKLLVSKEFFKSVFIVTIGICFLEASGMHYIASYVLEIMTKLTGNKSYSLYFTLGLDLTRVLAITLSTGCVRKINRRILISSAGTMSIIILALTSLFNYLQESKVLVLPWLSATMLILYCFILDFAIPVVNIVKGEIFPIGYKGMGITVAGIIHTLATGFVLKLTSIMLASLETYGTFFVYVIIMAGSLALYIYILPETKDRTLQSIENEMLGLKLTNQDVFKVELASILKK